MGGGVGRKQTRGAGFPIPLAEQPYVLRTEVIKYGKKGWELESLPSLRARLRIFLAHELEHIRDVRPETWPEEFNKEYYAKRGYERGGEDFKSTVAYASSSQEVMAKIREFVERAKQKRTTVRDSMEMYLKWFAKFLEGLSSRETKERASIPRVINRLRKAYTELLNKRYRRWQ
jgi:hypothetical protein